MLSLPCQAGAEQNDIDLLKQTKMQLEELFMLVVVGEFNSGKSSFLNALLGKKYLKEGGDPLSFPIYLGAPVLAPSTHFFPALSALLSIIIHIYAQVTPTTSKITVVRYSKTSTPLVASEDANRVVIYLPVDWLKAISTMFLFELSCELLA